MKQPQKNAYFTPVKEQEKKKISNIFKSKPKQELIKTEIGKVEQGKVDQEKKTYFCFKCWKDFPLSEKDDHVLVHNMDEEEKRVLNSMQANPKECIQDYKFEECHLSNKDIELLNSTVKSRGVHANPFDFKRKSMSNPFNKTNDSNRAKQNDKIDCSNSLFSNAKNKSNSNKNNNKYYNNQITALNHVNAQNEIVLGFNGNDQNINNKKTFNLNIQDLSNVVDLIQDRLVDDNRPNANRPRVITNAFPYSIHNLNSKTKTKTSLNELNNKISQLSETVIETLDKLNSDNMECAICLIDYKLFDKCIYLPCIHYFHSQCIKDWLIKKQDCPICLNNPFS